MALILNATWGSSSANSYCTVVEAAAYHESRYHTSDWLDAGVTTTAMKNASLVWATSLIDQLFKWDGTKFSQAQALACPRYGVYDIDSWPVDMINKPAWIANATAEYAYWLLQEDLISSANDVSGSAGSSDLTGFKEIKVGSITLKSSIGESKGESSAVNMLPVSVFLILKPYGTMYNSGQRKIIR